jgi:hypothetical protein
MLLRALSMACRRIGAQIDLIWTVNCQPELDCATAQNGGSARVLFSNLLHHLV